MRARTVAALLAAVALWCSGPASPAADPSSGPTREEWDKVVRKAADYLKSVQNPDGSWSQSPQGKLGGTGVIVTGLLRCGVSPDDEPAAKGLKHIEGLVNPQ